MKLGGHLCNALRFAGAPPGSPFCRVARLAAVLIPILICTEAWCAPVPICTSSGDQYNAAIWGSTIVWEDHRATPTTQGDIYAYNLDSSETLTVCGLTSSQLLPAIWGDTIVWMDGRAGKGAYDIYSYNLATGTESPIATSSPDKWLPSIYGNRVCWEQNAGGVDEWDIYSAVIGGPPEPICTAAGGQYCARISGSRIAWKDVRGGGSGWTMYSYDLLTHQETCIGGAVSDGGGDIWGDTVVWEDDRTSGTTKTDIFAYGLGSGQESAVCTNAQRQWEPAVWGDNVVWMDQRSGNWDIYLYNMVLHEEVPLVTETGNQKFPAIYEDKVVYENDPDTVGTNGNSDIYMVYVPSRYMTTRTHCVGLNNRSLSDPIIEKASPAFQFVAWGKVSAVDSSSFTLDDGSGKPIKVIAPGYTSRLTVGDNARAEGVCDAAATQRTLICPTSQLTRLR